MQKPSAETAPGALPIRTGMGVAGGRKQAFREQQLGGMGRRQEPGTGLPAEVPAYFM